MEVMVRTSKHLSMLSRFIKTVSRFRTIMRLEKFDAFDGFRCYLVARYQIIYKYVWWNTRHAYGFQKTPYQMYIELFSQNQDNQKPDLFVSRVRSWFSRLTGDLALSEHLQLDITYGLLNPKIRDIVPPDKMNTFRGTNWTSACSWTDFEWI